MASSDHVSTPLGEIVLAFGAFSLVTVALVEFYFLGYYGLGLSSSVSAVENINSQRWSHDVKCNVQQTYVSLLVSYALCILSAIAVFSCDPLFCLFSNTFTVAADFIIELIVQNGKAFASLNATGYRLTQKLTWLIYCSFLGGLASPSLLFGPIPVHMAVHVTFFLILVLTIISLTAPVGKFVGWERNLKIFDVVVLVGTIGSYLFPTTTLSGAIFFTISFYGGLIMFQLFFLCHSQEAHMAAYNATEGNPFCPSGVAIPMLLDTINIFSRIVVMIPSA